MIHDTTHKQLPFFRTIVHIIEPSVLFYVCGERFGGGGVVRGERVAASRWHCLLVRSFRWSVVLWQGKDLNSIECILRDSYVFFSVTYSCPTTSHVIKSLLEIFCVHIELPHENMGLFQCHRHGCAIFSTFAACNSTAVNYPA